LEDRLSIGVSYRTIHHNFNFHTPLDPTLNTPTQYRKRGQRTAQYRDPPTMFNNRSSGGSTATADVDYLDYASISATNNKKNSPKNYSFLDAFPTSPDCSPIGKRGGIRSSLTNKSSDGNFPSIITTASVVEGAFPTTSYNDINNVSVNINNNISHHIPYESDELITSIDDRSPTSTSRRDNTLYYSCIADNSSEEEVNNNNRWVGRGVGGKELQLSVCSISPETIVSTEKSTKKKRQSFIPRSINFQQQQRSAARNSKLPMLEENKIVNLDILGKKVQTVSSRVLQDVEELSVDLSILSDVDSVASAMTKESVVNLADRLEKMERQLLDLAGVKTTKTDALRALAKSTHKQSKRANSLQKKLVKQEKKISTLNDMCDRLMDSNRRSKVVKSKLKNDIDTLKDKLYESEVYNQELLSKLHKAEEENVKKSRLLLQSYSEHNQEMKQKYNELKSESQRRADNDNITIQTLKSQMVDMTEVHSRKEKRSEQKVQILLQIKTALEEQIRLLEEEEDDVSI